MRRRPFLSLSLSLSLCPPVRPLPLPIFPHEKAKIGIPAEEEEQVEQEAAFVLGKRRRKRRGGSSPSSSTVRRGAVRIYSEESRKKGREEASAFGRGFDSYFARGRSYLCLIRVCLLFSILFGFHRSSEIEFLSYRNREKEEGSDDDDVRT